VGVLGVCAFLAFSQYELFSFVFCFAEFGIVWGIAVLYRHEELNAEETIEEKGSQNQDSVNGFWSVI
jgi:hypothetical protein